MITFNLVLQAKKKFQDLMEEKKNNKYLLAKEKLFHFQKLKMKQCLLKIVALL